MDFCIILTTCPNQKEAEELAGKLVEKKLAACVQLSEISSFYRWDGLIHHEPEIRLLIKTDKVLYDAVERFILENHSYEIPQIVQIPIEGASYEYRHWMSNQMSYSSVGL
jgi:periplasmic divalent cation tolerance protein